MTREQYLDQCAENGEIAARCFPDQLAFYVSEIGTASLYRSRIAAVHTGGKPDHFRLNAAGRAAVRKAREAA